MDDLKNKLNEKNLFAKLNKIEIKSVSKENCYVFASVNENSFDGKYISSAFLSAVAETSALGAAFAIKYDENIFCANQTLNIISRSSASSFVKAKSTLIHSGKNTAVYESFVYDDNENLLAKGNYTIIL